VLIEKIFLFNRFADFSETDKIYTGDTEAFYFDNISAEDAKLFPLKQTYKSLLFFLRIWIFLSGWQYPASPAVKPSG